MPTDDWYLPDGQNTQLSQVAQKQPAQLPDGSPGIWLQIPYLQEFFSTNWYLIQQDTFELYVIYDTILAEIPYHAKSQPFDLVALYTDLQEHLKNRMSHIRMRMEWVIQITDSYMKWIGTAAVSKPLPNSMLSLNERK